LGYETRIVSGFYADPKKYDRQSRITSIFAENAHFWVAVLASSSTTPSTNADGLRNSWITVEPSPGYEVLLAPESLWSRLFLRAALTWQAVRSNPVGLLAILSLMGIAWRKRVDLCDASLTAWWLLNHRWGDARYQIKSTLRLLERRARVRGYPRSKGVSLNRWRLSADSQNCPSECWESHFLHLANWALYGNGYPAGYAPNEVQALCAEAATNALRPRRARRDLASSTSSEQAA
jgi:hypothetical protein